MRFHQHLLSDPSARLHSSVGSAEHSPPLVQNHSRGDGQAMVAGSIFPALYYYYYY